MTLCLSEYVSKHGHKHVCQRDLGHSGMHQEQDGATFKATYRWHNTGRLHHIHEQKVPEEYFAGRRR